MNQNKINGETELSKKLLAVVANGVRKIAVGTSIAQYGLLEIKSFLEKDLLMKAERSIRATNDFQDFFIHHKKATGPHVLVFAEEFYGNKMVLMAELVELAWKLDVEGLEALNGQLTKCFAEEEERLKTETDQK